MSKSKKVKETIHAERVDASTKTHAWVVVVLAAAGLVICLYLYSFHIELLLGEIKSGPLCGTENGLGCHAVASGPYSSLLGFPLAAWGAVFFSSLTLLGFGGVIFWRDSGRVFLRWTFILAVFGLVFDLYLAYIMIFKIGAACWLCVATYAINFIIAIVLAKGVLKESGPRTSLSAIFPGTRDAQGPDLYYRNVIKGLLIGGVLLAAVAGAAGSQFLSRSLTEDDREQLAKIKKNLSQQQPRYMDVKNRPAMGAENAAVTVIEFSDFLCPFCAKASRYIKLTESGTRDTARFVFRHFPLDKACNSRLRSNIHPGACLLAEAAVCAFEQDRFWEYHDIAFKTKTDISRATVVDIASKLGLNVNEFESCLDSGRGQEVVREDIAAAHSAGIRSTPTLIINGRQLRGVPKPWMFNEILLYSKQNLPPPR